MRQPTILLTTTGYIHIREYLDEALPGMRLEVVDPAMLREHGGAAEVLIPAVARIDGPVMDRVHGLRLIQQWGSGLEGVNLGEATARGIAVANVPAEGTGNAESVAEWCVMAAIALSRRLSQLETGIRAGASWGAPMGKALLGRTAGIVGVGGIGRALAQRLLPFGMELYGVTRNPTPELAERVGMAWLGGLQDLPHLLARSDYLFLCLPLSSQTRQIIDSRALAALPDDACIINAGRGGLLDHHALLRMLSEGRFLGVALDVFEHEPLDPGSPLLTHPRILATPHIAGTTDASYRGIAAQVADNVRRLVEGRTLRNAVNMDRVS